MSEVDLVRASRDGDQFHYHWAARQCLRLLSPSDDLVAVSIEGPSSKEAEDGELGDGAELIDVGLYFGSEAAAVARCICYIQLKHSTLHGDKPWTGSGLKKSIIGFAKRFKQHRSTLGANQTRQKISFRFITNRPIAESVLQSIEDLAHAAKPRHTDVALLLAEYSDLMGIELSEFFGLLVAEPGEPELWDQRNLLALDTTTYLSDPDYDAAGQLVTLVSRLALSDAASDPVVRKTDVLRALKVDPDQLFPAPCEILPPSFELSRADDAEVLKVVLEATSPVILHADGGVGKSMTVRRLTGGMPVGSEAILYDCFGDGMYRNTLNRRHRHRDALVQIGNEMSSRGLCQPLIPSPSGDDKQLMRAFRARLVQATTLLRASDSEAVLCLVIDAADNAGMAAEEVGERAFVGDLMSMPLPEGLRLVFTCRSHRQHYLKPIPEAIPLPIKPFSMAESASHLRNYYPDASDQEVAEFALLSSSNPRVQALALAQGVQITEMLKRLGPTPTTVDRTIADLLAAAFSNLRARTGAVEAGQIDVICRCLSVLRPLVPISVLAHLSSTTEDQVRSFAYDLRRPLLIKGESLHFLDEPSETWFRENFKPDAEQLAPILQRLKPLAKSDAYAAAALPQLLLKAGHLDELLELALSDEGLPTNNPIARRDVELQRLSFALKAALAGGRYLAAAKLATRAAGERAAEERQNKLVQENTDLAAQLLDVSRIEEVVSRRTFRSTWMGSANVYYAGLLSGRPELVADAGSRLRIATDWLYSWGRQIRDGESEHEVGTVTDEDRAEFAISYLRVHGAVAAAGHLRRWSPKGLTFDAGRMVASRLFDQGDSQSVDALFEAAGNNVWLLLGIVLEAQLVRHPLECKQLRRLGRLLTSRHVRLKEDDSYNERWKVLSAVVAVIYMSLEVLPKGAFDWASLLARYLPASPPYDVVQRHQGPSAVLLRAYALYAELSGKPLTLKGMAPDRLREKIGADGKPLDHDGEAREFCRDLEAVMPWYVAEARIACTGVDSADDLVSEGAVGALQSADRERYFENKPLAQAIAVQWVVLLAAARQLTGPSWSQFQDWFHEVKPKLWPSTLVSICRAAAHEQELELFAMQTSAYTFQRIEELTNEQAESRVGLYTDLARSVVALSPEESAAYFDRAVVIASRIGEENLSRWNGLVHLGRAAADSRVVRPELAYRFAQAAELTYSYSDDHFDWRGTVDVLAGLCPSSLLAIFSRWRDRDFGHHKGWVPRVFKALVRNGSLPSKAFVALGGIDASWNRLSNLERALADEGEPSAKQALLQTAYRYMRVQSEPKATWLRLKEIAEELGVELLDIDRLASRDVGQSASAASGPSLTSPRGGDSGQPLDRDAWKVELDSISVVESMALKSTWKSLQSRSDPVSFSDYVEEGLRRAGPSRTAAYISALAAWDDLCSFEVRSLLECVSLPLRELAAVRVAIKAVVLGLCRREPARISRRGHWVMLPLEELDAAGVVPDGEVVDALLEGHARLVEGSDASDLFHMLDALSRKLAPSEAAEALEYGLVLLQEALVDEKGDGAWSEQLRPPTDIVKSLAGYVWAGLGSPTTAVRWQFAHVVRNVVELRWDALLRELATFGMAAVAGPFGDRNLVFYGWHARQWLLLGLARGGHRRGDLPSECLTLLRQELKAPHVVIRALAAEALESANAWDIASDGARPGDVNIPSGVESEADPFGANLRDDVEVDEKAAVPEFHFGIDIGPYWFAPLGRCFNLKEQAVERRAGRAIMEHMGLYELAYGSDARYSRGVFPKHSMDTHHSHGTMPKIDNLQAYAGYHGMMIAAAAMLAECPAVRGGDHPETRFEEWIREHLVNRQRGMWLADLRDPQLTHVPSLKERSTEQDWYWTVTPDYLDAQLVSDGGHRVLWGEWGFGADGDTESVSVASALTTKQFAPALLTALQTAVSDRHYLPSAGYRDDEESAEALPLRGWIARHESGSHLDDADPWGHGLRSPDMTPADWVVQSLGLSSSQDGRIWTARNGGAARAEAWVRQTGHGREQASNPGGRLVADARFIEALLAENEDSCLVLSVSVRVRPDRHRYGGEEFEQFPWPYRRYYLLDRDGITRTL